MDSKYGVLLTKDDVRKLLIRLGIHTEEAELDLALAALQTEGALRFDPDEPQMVLRAKDKAAPAAICGENTVDAVDYYGAVASILPIAHNGAHLRLVKTTADAFRAWQSENPNKVKIPDSDPPGPPTPPRPDKHRPIG